LKCLVSTPGVGVTPVLTPEPHFKIGVGC
jgi:hypothetical protein